jgi:predicted SprT family Zn-dependent metalloprotease
MEMFNECFAECVRRAKAVYPAFETPKFIIGELKGNAAGQARFAEWEVWANKTYCMANPKGILERTIPHEIAHLLAVAIHGSAGRGHGRLWAETFRLLAPNADHSQYHTYGVVNDAAKRVDRMAEKVLQDVLNKKTP